MWEKLIQSIRWFNYQLAITVAWAGGLLVALTCLVVILRYGFNIGWISLQESLLYLHSLLFLLGSAFTLIEEGHVRVDIFYRRWSVKTQAVADIIGTITLLWPVTLFISFISWDYVFNSWAINEGSFQAGGLPFIYIQKSFILIFALQMFLQGFVMIENARQKLKGH